MLNCFLLALQFEERLYYRNNKCRRKYLRLYRKYENNKLWKTEGIRNATIEIPRGVEKEKKKAVYLMNFVRVS